jgi:hypothetical protein
VKADVAAALDFLEKLYPTGPWFLVSIVPDVGTITAATFGPGARDACSRWIGEQNRPNKTEAGGNANVYYHVNQVARPLNTKAKEVDIARMPYLHVDSDPRVQDRDDKTPKAEYLAGELKRIAEKFEAPPQGIPRPTVIVYSGGGVNALWRLQEPVVIDGDQAAADHHKRYNLQLEQTFEGDHCHNVDRILRLPGTVNWPDKRKRGKGRGPTMASLVRFDDVSYPISAFVAAPVVQASSPERGKFSGTSAPRVQISGNIERLGDVKDLPRVLPRLGPGMPMDPALAQIISVGYDPNDPARFSGDRSRAVTYVACELTRLGASDDTIYGILTDPDLGISGHVLDQGSNANRAAERFIEYAKDHAVEPRLAALNERYAVIKNFNGKCRVVEEVVDPDTGRTKLSAQTFEDFRNGLLNETIEIQVTTPTGKQVPKAIDVGSYWLKNKYRRTFDSFGFVPGRDVPGMYNLWQGFATAPLPGDAHKSFMAHVHQVICGGDPVLFTYVWSWMSRAVQQPALPAETAIVMRGGQGTGKSTFARWFGALWGRHYRQISDAKHLTGQFNAHLADTCVLFADEAFYAGDPTIADRLKRLVTEATITIERKGVDVEPDAPNRLKIIMASNHDWVLRVDKDDRRFCVVDLPDVHRGDRAYWDRIDEDMRPAAQGGKGGLANLLFALQTFDISAFNVRAIPRTAGHRDQAERSFSVTEDWWLTKLRDGIILPGVPWSAPFPKRDLLTDYLMHAQRMRVHKPDTDTTLGKFLKKVTDAKVQTGRMTVQVRDGDPSPGRTEVVPFYQMPGIDECRAAWDKLYGGPTDWPNLRDIPLPLRRHASVM